jgi:predicted nucleic acid-binding protein
VLIRPSALGELSEAAAAARRSALNAGAARWHIAHLGREVVERARRALPVEPVGALDALHLATALVMRAAVADLEMLSLDARIRDVAAAVGLAVQPR